MESLNLEREAAVVEEQPLRIELERPPVQLVLACDEAYAMPLATFLRSLAETNIALWPIDATILTPGLTEATTRRVEESVPTGSVRMQWNTIDTSLFSSCTLLSHVSSTTFARLVLPQIPHLQNERVVYLDVDMLVLSNIEYLLDVDLCGHAIGAVADLHVDADVAGASDGGPAGIPNVASYFNAGVLVIDMKESQRRRIFERAIEYLVEHPTTPYADQDALNVACDESWLALDQRWNFQAHKQNRLEKMSDTERPSIVHFVSGSKPWKPASVSSNAGFYNSFRDRTRFRRSWSVRAWEAVCRQAHRVRHRVARGRSGTACFRQ